MARASGTRRPRPWAPGRGPGPRHRPHRGRTMSMATATATSTGRTTPEAGNEGRRRAGKARDPRRARALTADRLVEAAVRTAAAAAAAEGDATDGYRESTAGRSAERHGALAQVGAVSLRAPMGHCARGLQRVGR